MTKALCVLAAAGTVRVSTRRSVSAYTSSVSTTTSTAMEKRASPSESMAATEGWKLGLVAVPECRVQCRALLAATRDARSGDVSHFWVPWRPSRPAVLAPATQRRSDSGTRGRGSGASPGRHSGHSATAEPARPTASARSASPPCPQKSSRGLAVTTSRVLDLGLGQL